MNLVTGATGLLGSYIVEKLVGDGQKVRALVRPSSDISFIETLDIEIVVADLTDEHSLENICAGVDTIYHCAGQVGDWGHREDFEKNTLEATLNIAQAALKANVKRFVHISSVSVYGQLPNKGFVVREDAPLGINVPRWNYYTQTKVAVEKKLWQMHQQQHLPLTVIRPSWIYGPRDLKRTDRLYQSLRKKRYKIIGSGNNRLNTVFVGNVAEACVLAGQSEKALGQAYNCSNDGCITQKEFFCRWAQAFNYPIPKRQIPYGIAYSVAFACEIIGKMIRMKNPPFITRYIIWHLGCDIYFPCDKIRNELGWTSKISYTEGIKQTADWYLNKIKKTPPTTNNPNQPPM